ncbi:MAG: histidinol-phosphate transaminase [Odoribacter sp.]|nr:histidinol-phosphate transaminase [Odoribacter sp.]
MKFNFQNIVRENIKNMQPYSCARDEYKGKEAVFLDANENPFENGCNRYPDPYQTELKSVIAEMKDVKTEKMLLGNGSDEVIDLLIRCVCVPGKDNMVVFSPGYGMYEVSAAINDIEVRKINLTADFQPDLDGFLEIRDENTKIVFLCTPNNPLGTVVPLETIEKFCAVFNGLVVVDEAYIDFANSPSAITLLDTWENCVVMQTLSKSWGMAGLRLGICYASSVLIQILNRIKPPYNISGLTQSKAIELLKEKESFNNKLATIKEEREHLLKELSALELFENIYPSDANFILVTSKDARKIYTYLTDNKVVVRLRDIPPLIPGGIRISIGTPEENRRLIALLKAWKEVTL